MKILSWNVNGLRAILRKGFLEFLEERGQVEERGQENILAHFTKKSRGKA